MRNRGQKVNQKIIDFYENKLKVGRHDLSFDQIVALKDERLEKCHDYIQWLFPLPEPSAFMKNAPLLDHETAMLIADNYSIRVMEALKRMTKFWRITLNTDSSKKKPHLTPGQYWMIQGDHNHHRLSRVMQFLTLLSKVAKNGSTSALYSNLAESILYALLSANDDHEFATKETVRFWENALKKGWRSEGT